ncbi:MAG: SDR family oxidoreductase [Bacteroidales bacterium]|nr:SDR family oxidoreductase [Bacteroidales bacterium]
MQKIVLITGATSGMGKAMAESLAENGYQVFATGRNIPNESGHQNLFYRYLDVKNNDSVKGAVSGIMEQFHHIDILINSAGFGLAGPLEETPFEEIYNLFETNYFGTIRVIRHVIPVMRKQGDGLIVNMSSIGGRIGLPFQGIYSSSKFAIECLTEALRIELKPFGIKVCMIEPGDYHTGAIHNRHNIIPTKDSPYQKRLKNYFDLLDKNITKGGNPEVLGKLILKIVTSAKPRLCYKSGRFTERITPFARNFLPYSIFGWFLARFYKINN